MSQTLNGFYVSFSGESDNPINNIYALSPSGDVLSSTVLDTSQTYQELRGMVFGPDGNLYVAQAYKHASAIRQFSGTLAPGSYTRKFLSDFVTPAASGGLVHPYQPSFGLDDNLYVSSQDTNVVSSFWGPGSASPDTPGQAMPNSKFVQSLNGTFYPGTFVGAYSAGVGIPPNTPVPTAQGGLTFATTNSSTHSVRGLAFDSQGNLYVADEGNDRVAVFDRNGNLLGVITQSKNHSLNEPVALFFDTRTGTLYIGSPGNQRLFTFEASQLASRDFTANSLINDSKLEKLSGIAVDPSGNIYTCNRKNDNIYKWDPDGSSPSTFANFDADSPEQIIPVYTPIVGS